MVTQETSYTKRKRQWILVGKPSRNPVHPATGIPACHATHPEINRRQVYDSPRSHRGPHNTPNRSRNLDTSTAQRLLNE